MRRPHRPEGRVRRGRIRSLTTPKELGAAPLKGRRGTDGGMERRPLTEGSERVVLVTSADDMAASLGARPLGLAVVAE